MEEPKQDIRETLAGESGSCPKCSPPGEPWQRVVGKVVVTAVGSGPVMNRATGPRVLSQDQLTKCKQQQAVSGTHWCQGGLLSTPFFFLSPCELGLTRFSWFQVQSNHTLYSRCRTQCQRMHSDPNLLPVRFGKVPG